MNRKELESVAEKFIVENKELEAFVYNINPLNLYIAGFLAGRDAAASEAGMHGWDEGDVGSVIAEKIKALGETE